MEGRDDGGVDVTAVQTLGKETHRNKWLEENTMTKFEKQSYGRVYEGPSL